MLLRKGYLEDMPGSNDIDLGFCFGFAGGNRIGKHHIL